MTLSDGTERDISVPESKGIKLASRRVNKAYKRNGKARSKNHYKRKAKLQAAYEKNTNRKHDLANNEVHKILTNYDFVGIQDEMIANWHKGLFGKQVQHSAMGFIKRKLKTSSKIQVVPRDFPSTQKCPVCGRNTKHPLEKRDYDCAYCGYHHPSRDVKSAEMILQEAVNLHSCGEHTAKSPAEVRTSADIHCMVMLGKFPPAKQEAQVL